MNPVCARRVVFFGWLALAGLGVAFSLSATAQETETTKKTGENSQPADTKTSSGSPKIYTVKAGPFRIETELEGILEAENMTPITLRPDVYKTLEVVKAVAHGAIVKKGEQLVELETKELDEQINDARLAVELGELALKDAKENLQFLEATMPLDLAAAERSQMIARRELKQYLETDRPLSLRSATQSLKNSQGQLENVTEELRQLEKMYKADDLTEETEEIILKRARRSVESAELFFEMAKVRADRSLNETIPEQEQTLKDAAQRAELGLAKLKATLPVEHRKQQIALDKLERGQLKLEEKLGKLEGDRKLFEVTAPVAGVVYYGNCHDGKWTSIDTIAKQLEPGKTLTANQVFITIVQLRPLQVRLSLAEKELRSIKSGVKGFATPTAFPDQELPVTIRSVAIIPDASTKFDALASIQLKDDSALVPGMTCKLKLTSYEKQNAIAIPESALFEDKDQADKTFVYVPGPKEKPVKRFVTAGQKHGGKVEILAGLKAGESVLTEKPNGE